MSLNTSVPTNINDTYAVPSLPIENISNKEDKSNKGIANGYAPLDGAGKVPEVNLPAIDVSGQIATHNSATTSVHGISDTADLATKTYADEAVFEHKEETTSIHGIVNTGELIQSTAIGPNTDKVVTFNYSGSSTDNSEIAGWGFGVANGSGDAYIEPTGLTVEGSGKYVHIRNDKVELDNGAKLRKGTTDAGDGGYKGIALECSAQYELKWEAGRLYTMQQDGTTIRSVEHCMSAPTSNDDGTKGYVIGTCWVMDSGKTYVCTDATEEDAVWEIKFSQEDSQVNGEYGAGGSINTSGFGGTAGGSINTSGSPENGVGGSINTSNGGGSIRTDLGYIELGCDGSRATIKSRSSDNTVETPSESGRILIASANGVNSCDSSSEHNRFGDSVRGSIENQLNYSKGQIVTLGGGDIFTYGLNISKFVLAFSSANIMSGTYLWNGKWYYQVTGSQKAMAYFSRGYLVFVQEEGWDPLFIAGLNDIENPNNWTVGIEHAGSPRPYNIQITYGPSTYSIGSQTVHLDVPSVGGGINTSNGGGSIDTRGTGSIQLGNSGTRTTLNGSAGGSNKTITLPNATGTVSLEGHTHTIANVAGLQTALDGKQASGSYAPATGISPSAITGTAVITTDSRLSNNRTPTSHASTHAVGVGSDPITASMIGASALGHGHAISEISNLQTNLNAIPKTYAGYSFTATTATTADQWQATITIPANTLGGNGYITGHIWAACSASSSAKRIRAYITNVNPNNAIPTGAGTFTRFVNLTTSTSNIATTAISIMRSFTIMNRNSVTSQIVQPSASGGLASTTSADTFEELAYDTTQTLYIVIGLQKDLSTDTLQLKAYNLVVTYSA